MSLDSIFTSDGAWRTAAEIARSVTSGQVTALYVVEAALARIERHNPELNVFTDITVDRARTKAGEIDRAIAAGESVGPLAGVPFAVKNLFDIAGLTTRAGSKISRNNAPAARCHVGGADGGRRRGVGGRPQYGRIRL